MVCCSPPLLITITVIISIIIIIIIINHYHYHYLHYTQLDSFLESYFADIIPPAVALGTCFSKVPCLSSLHSRSRFQWKWYNKNYQLTKQNWLVCELRTVLINIQQCLTLKFVFCPVKSPGPSRNGPQVSRLRRILAVPNGTLAVMVLDDWCRQSQLTTILYLKT